jgi:surfeit locus 1 family protein
VSEPRPSSRRSVLPEIVSGCVFLLMLRLGLWQLDRAEQKEQRHQQYAANRASTPCTGLDCLLQRAVDTAALGTAVRLEAPVWLPQRLLLDNQTHEGRAGYLLFEALDTRPIVLVQRAWIAAPASRSDLPDLPSPAFEQPLALSAEVAWPPATGLVFGEPLPAEGFAAGTWRLQSLEAAVLESVFSNPVAPMVLRELDQQQDGLLRPWREPRSGADKHRAYAVQWFVMSAVLILVHWNFRRRRPPGNA